MQREGKCACGSIRSDKDAFLSAVRNELVLREVGVQSVVGEIRNKEAMQSKYTHST
jgi:hypothetical protein